MEESHFAPHRATYLVATTYDTNISLDSFIQFFLCAAILT